MTRRSRSSSVEELIGSMPRWQLAAMRFNEVVAQRLGIAGSDLQCLFLLEHDGPSAPGVLAGQVGLTTGSTSRMVERLLAADLVTREPDPADRRRVVVTIRPEASDRLRAFFDPLDEALRQLLGGMDQATVRRFGTFVGEAAQVTSECAEAARLSSSPSR